MKFAKYLEAESVPEWRRKYIDYKGLKKCLKAIVRQNELNRQETLILEFDDYAENGILYTETPKTSFEMKRRVSVKTPEEMTLSISEQLGSSQRPPSQNVKEEPRLLKLRPTTSRLNTPVSPRLSLNRSPSAASALSMRRIDSASIEEGEYFPHGKPLSKWTNRYDGVTGTDPLVEDAFLDVDGELERRLLTKGEAEKEFFRRLNLELDKITNFYDEHEAKAIERFGHLRQQIQLYRRHCSQTMVCDGAKVKSLVNLTKIEDDDDGEKEAKLINSKKARSKLKRAVMEFYRGLILLQNYQALNKTGFVKILKKFEKTAHMQASDLYMRKVDASSFSTSRDLQHIRRNLEDLYADTFEGGSRRRGLRALRLPTAIPADFHRHLLRFGLYIGLGIPVLIQGLLRGFELSQSDPAIKYLLQVFGALFLPTFFVMLFSINMYIWQLFHVNYKFIFELDPRDNLDLYQFVELPGLAFLFFSYCVYFAFEKPFMAATWFPLFYASIVLGVLLMPIKIFYYSARIWFFRVIWKNIRAGFLHVAFADFFIADEFCSLVYVLMSMELFVCAYAYSWTDLGARCNYNLWWYTPVIAMIPQYWRLMQCFKRYRDSKMFFPHMVNAGKYAVGIMVLWVTTWAKVADSWAIRALWIVVAIVATLYTNFWDLYMDWGMFEQGSTKRFLRSEITYPAEWYYFAMVTNVVIRCLWILTISPTQYGISLDNRVIPFILALLEIYRRFQWNIFRMENEHVNNCGMFRATKEIPLPYAVGNAERDVDPGTTSAISAVTGERYSSDEEKLD